MNVAVHAELNSYNIEIENRNQGEKNMLDRQTLLTSAN